MHEISSLLQGIHSNRGTIKNNNKIEYYDNIFFTDVSSFVNGPKLVLSPPAHMATCSTTGVDLETLYVSYRNRMNQQSRDADVGKRIRLEIRMQSTLG